MLIEPLENRGESRSEKAPRDMRKSASSMILGNHHSCEADGSQKPLQTSHMQSAEPLRFACWDQRNRNHFCSFPSKFKTSISHWQNGNVNSTLARAVKCSFQASSSFYAGEHWGWVRVAFFLIAHILHRDKVSEWLQCQHIDLLWVLSPLPFPWFKFKNKWNNTLASLAGMCGRG